MDILSVVLGAILGVFMSNGVNQGNKQRRIKANTINTYLTQLYIISILMAIVDFTAERDLYTALTTGAFGYFVYHVSIFWYNYMTKIFSVLIFIIIAYCYTFFFYKKAKVLYGEHKSITMFMIFNLIVFAMSALIVNMQVFFNLGFWQIKLTFGIFIIMLTISAIMLILELINFAKENKSWL